MLAVRISEADREVAGGYNWLTSWTGLYRDVLLEGTAARHLADVFPQADGGAGTVRVRVTPGGAQQDSESLEIVVRQAVGGKVVAQQDAHVPGADDQVAGQLKVEDARRWELDDPLGLNCLHARNRAEVLDLN